MKRLKFLPTILMLVLCVGVLAIGIYAITPSKNTIDGSITINASNQPVKITVLKDGEPIIAEHEVRAGKTYNFDTLFPEGLAFETDEANQASEVAPIELTFRIKNISEATSGTTAFADETVAAFFTAGSVVMADNELADGDNDIKTIDTIYDETAPVANVKLDTYTPITPNETIDMTIKFTIAGLYDDEKNGDIDYNLYIEKYIPTRDYGTANAKLTKLPVTLTTINNSTFTDANVTNVEYVAIPSTVTTIADGTYSAKGAFAGFSALKEVRLPDSITKIGSYAFYDKTALASITLPDSITEIGFYAFYNNTALASITLPESITRIGNYAFYNNTALTSITLPNELTSIGDYAFEGCGITGITLPNGGLSNWGSNPFKGCNIEWVVGEFSTGDYTFKDGTYTWISDSSAYADYNLKPLILNLVIGPSAEYFEWEGFANCSNLVSIESFGNVTGIPYAVFSNCSKLKSVNVSDKITYIDGVDAGYDGAFNGCSSLTSVYIPASVTSIYGGAFYGCPITNLTIESDPGKVWWTKYLNYDEETGEGSYTYLENPTNELIITILTEENGNATYGEASGYIFIKKYDSGITPTN